MATLVAWHSVPQNAVAQEAGGSGDKYGMLCGAPQAQNSPVYGNAILEIPQANGDPIVLTIKTEASTSKFVDLEGVSPYNSISFSGTVSVDIYHGETIVTFAVYYADYLLECDEDNGNIAGSVSNRPWTQRIIALTVGTTQVGITIDAINPPLIGQMAVDTGVKFSGAAVDSNQQAYILNFDPDTIKIRNTFYPKKK